MSEISPSALTPNLEQLYNSLSPETTETISLDSDTLAETTFLQLLQTNLQSTTLMVTSAAFTLPDNDNAQLILSGRSSCPIGSSPPMHGSSKA